MASSDVFFPPPRVSAPLQVLGIRATVSYTAFETRIKCAGTGPLIRSNWTSESRADFPGGLIPPWILSINPPGRSHYDAIE
jgi:hypothetical protein